MSTQRTEEPSPDLNHPSALARFGQYLVYLLVRALELVLRALPLGLCFRIGSFVGSCAYFVMPKYRKLAARNLTVAFHDTLGEKDRSALSKKAFANLGANLICSFKLPLLSEAQIESRVEVEGLENYELARDRGKGVICCIPHMGNWEILTQAPSLVAPGLNQGTIYQALSNPYLDEHVRKRRERLGYKLFDRREGFYGPLAFVRDGGAIGILVDQHAGNQGTWAPFFGKLASTTNLPALIARRTGAALVPLAVCTVGPARWKLVYGQEIHAEHVGEVRSSERLVAEMNHIVESLIRRSPEDWFWVHNRWKTPRPNFLLGGYRRGLAYPDDMTEKDLQRFEMLLRSPNWLGDACMALPAVRAMSKGRPDLVTTVLCPENLAPFWERVPEVDFVIAKPKDAGPRAVGKLAKDHPMGYDAAVLFPNSLRSAFEARAMGARGIVGYAGNRRSRLLDSLIEEPEEIQPPVHQAVRYLRIAHQVGGDTDGAFQGPYLETRPTERPGIRIGLCPGAAYGGAKQFPADRYATIAKAVAEQVPDLTWVIFGSGNDSVAADPIAAALGDRCQNLCGKTSLSELIDELAGCQALLSNDTGTMHLAGVIDVPVIAIFGSTEPILTGPLGKGHAIIRKHVSCSPCFLRECPLDFRCMNELDDQQITDAVLERVQSPVPAGA